MVSQKIPYFSQINAPLKNALIIAFLFFSTIASATDYYISSSGNDANNGLSSSTPWKTIAKVNSTFSLLKPGDRILFNRGDTFYGTITVNKSGSAGNPITLGAYGSGTNPIITGFTTISGWTNEGNGIYSKVITSEAQTNMVTIDGVNTGMGRYRDSTYLTYESFSTNVSITDNELGNINNWTGAEAVIRKNDWTLDRCTISNQTGNVLTYTSLGSNLNASANYGYFIQNDLKCVTAYGEWYHDTGTGKFYMYFGGVNPITKTVKVATINNLAYNKNGSDYITIDNLSFTGSIDNTIEFSFNSDHCIVQNCNVTFAGEDGIRFSGSYGIIDNNSVSDCNRTGIGTFYSGTNNVITNNAVTNIGIVKGLSKSIPGIWSPTCGIAVEYNNCLVQYNKIVNVGCTGILISKSANTLTIQNNYIKNICLVLDDGGGIYINNSHSSIIIDGNIILNSVGNTDGAKDSKSLAEGIYLDEYASNITVRNNTIANCSNNGIKLHKAHDNIIQNNIAFNNSNGIGFENWSGVGAIYNNTLNGNIFFAKAVSQLALAFNTTVNEIPGFGTAGNNYYARPMDDNYVIYTNQPSTGSKNRTLVDWQSFTKQDANSHKSPIEVTDINNIRFEFNETKTNKVITLDKPMIDIKGSKYVNSITLLPFTSVVLMVDPNPDPLVIPVYIGSIINNATPSLLEITYNVSLTNIVPAALAFSVQVNSVVRTVTVVAISGTKVQLTMASSIISGDVVTITYTKPTSNPLQTASGAIAVNISNQPVINNCINTAPTAVITSPLTNSSFPASANITITANALDSDGSISIVEFYNGSTKLGSKSAAPYSFTWNNVAAGNYSLTVVATDNLNAKTISSAISISVINGSKNNNQPPVIKISNPIKGNKYFPNSTITIDAIASDPDGSISKVEIYNGLVKLVELTSAPYTYTWKDVAAGSYSITAIATDNLNGTTVSSPVEFVVGSIIKYDANSEIVKLYPNPSDGHFSIEFISPLRNEKSEIIITDLAGKQVYFGPITKEETLKQFDLSNSKEGIYLMMIKDKEILVTKKIIIK
jgi:parallel beta-helix repeat protein